MADGRILALYGHSVPGKLARTPSTPPERLYHGTSPKVLEAIRQNGLQPMARQYVHLSNNRADALEVGRRNHPQPVLLIVNAAEAAKAGVAFYVRQRGSLARRSRAFAIHRDRRLKTWG
jgi:putative RNA 2'-phosphotransferase